MLLLLTSAVYGQPPTAGYNFRLDSSRVMYMYTWKTRSGDDSSWARKEYSDSTWRSVYLSSNMTGKKNSIQWYRTTVTLTGRQDEYEVLNIQVWGLPSAYEVYWDGDRIFSNGTVSADKKREVPGTIMNTRPLSKVVTTPGAHVLALRTSNHHTAVKWQYPYISIGYSGSLQAIFRNMAYQHLFDIGVFLLCTIFCLALFLGGGRQRSYLIFGVYCFFNLAFSAIIMTQYYLNVSIIYFNYISFLRSFAAPISIAFLNAFFIVNFNIPKKYFHMALTVGALLLVRALFSPSYVAFVQLYTVALLLYAAIKKEPGSVYALLGTILYTVMWLLYLWGNIREAFLGAELGFLFLVFISMSRQIKEQHRQHEASRLQSARLETELLKKNLQPHFLMNTLLSVISWMEENPQKAKELVQSFAEEFKVINKISSEKLIPITEEIKLCQIHLRLMGYRKDAQYSLECHNVKKNELIPPMVLHTLIENGLTHAYQGGENGMFRLFCEETAQGIRYRLQNDGSRLNKIAQKSEAQIEEGMGFKYVRARLQESYPGRWRFDYGLKNGVWETLVFIKK